MCCPSGCAVERLLKGYEHVWKARNLAQHIDIFLPVALSLFLNIAAVLTSNRIISSIDRERS
jgi:hypothetical protein